MVVVVAAPGLLAAGTALAGCEAAGCCAGEAAKAVRGTMPNIGGMGCPPWCACTAASCADKAAAAAGDGTNMWWW